VKKAKATKKAIRKRRKKNNKAKKRKNLCFLPEISCEEAKKLPRFVRKLDDHSQFLPLSVDAVDDTEGHTMQLMVDKIREQLRQHGGQLKTKARVFSKPSIAPFLETNEITNAELFDPATGLRFLQFIRTQVAMQYDNADMCDLANSSRTGTPGQIATAVRIILNWLLDDSSGYGGYLGPSVSTPFTHSPSLSSPRYSIFACKQHSPFS
jgi:hypothetical protein